MIKIYFLIHHALSHSAKPKMQPLSCYFKACLMNLPSSENGVKTAWWQPQHLAGALDRCKTFQKRRIPNFAGSGNGTLRGHADDGWDWQPDVDRVGLAWKVGGGVQGLEGGQSPAAGVSCGPMRRINGGILSTVNPLVFSV